MICFTLTNPPAFDAIIEQLEQNDEQQMLALINLVQPGYFLPGTRMMGDYYGIRQNGELVAVTGERMRMDGLTEISAVVTHPGFTGRKYAQQLVAHVANKNMRRASFLFCMLPNPMNGRSASISGLALPGEELLIFGK